MKRLLLTSLFFVAFAIAFHAQPPSTPANGCSNETVEKISSRGIKIGTKIDDLLSLFATDETQKVQLRNSASGPDSKHLGFEFFGVQPLPIDVKPDGKFDGISSYVFTLLDEKLAGFTVRYSRPKWKDSKQFAETMIAALSLPTIDKWERDDTLYCGDYKLFVSNSGTFVIEDRRLNTIIAERKKKYEEDQRIADLKKFRP